MLCAMRIRATRMFARRVDVMFSSTENFAPLHRRGRQVHSAAGDLLGFVQIFAGDGVVAEADGVELLEPVAVVGFGGVVVFGGDVEGFAVMFEADVPFLDEDLAGFD